MKLKKKPTEFNYHLIILINLISFPSQLPVGKKRLGFASEAGRDNSKKTLQRK